MGRHITLCCNLQGLQQTVLFCGDGINDLSALSAADVGYAVGSTEASIAAAVTSRGSVTGDSTTLQDSCGSHSWLVCWVCPHQPCRSCP